MHIHMCIYIYIYMLHAVFDASSAHVRVDARDEQPNAVLVHVCYVQYL